MRLKILATIALTLREISSLNIPIWITNHKSADNAYIGVVNRLKDLLDGRRQNQRELMKELLLNSLKNEDFKARLWLRDPKDKPMETPKAIMNTPDDELSHVVEKELKHAQTYKGSALFDRPQVMKKGNKEYLVLHPLDSDPFVTVIPNDIYYDVQKSCVNWLEDCSERGVRMRILQRIRSPYI